MLYEVIELRDPHYSAPDNSTIDAIVTWSRFPNEPMPFTASPLDPEEHGRKLYKDLVDGVYGPIGPYVAPEMQAAE